MTTASSTIPPQSSQLQQPNAHAQKHKISFMYSPQCNNPSLANNPNINPISVPVFHLQPLLQQQPQLQQQQILSPKNNSNSNHNMIAMVIKVKDDKQNINGGGIGREREFRNVFLQKNKIYRQRESQGFSQRVCNIQQYEQCKDDSHNNTSNKKDSINNNSNSNKKLENQCFKSSINHFSTTPTLNYINTNNASSPKQSQFSQLNRSNSPKLLSQLPPLSPKSNLNKKSNNNNNNVNVGSKCPSFLSQKQKYKNQQQIKNNSNIEGIYCKCGQIATHMAQELRQKCCSKCGISKMLQGIKLQPIPSNKQQPNQSPSLQRTIQTVEQSIVQQQHKLFSSPSFAQSPPLTTISKAIPLSSLSDPEIQQKQQQVSKTISFQKQTFNQQQTQNSQSIILIHKNYKQLKIQLKQHYQKIKQAIKISINQDLLMLDSLEKEQIKQCENKSKISARLNNSKILSKNNRQQLYKPSLFRMIPQNSSNISKISNSSTIKNSQNNKEISKDSNNNNTLSTIRILKSPVSCSSSQRLSQVSLCVQNNNNINQVNINTECCNEINACSTLLPCFSQRNLRQISNNSIIINDTHQNNNYNSNNSNNTNNSNNENIIKANSIIKSKIKQQDNNQNYVSKNLLFSFELKK